MAEGLRNGCRTQQLVFTQRGGNRGLENVKLARIGRMCDQRSGHAKVLAQDFGRRVLEPVAQQECVVLVEVSIVENQQKFTSVGAEALNRMWNATGKIPEVTNTHVIDKVSSLGVNGGNTGGPVQHVSPFGLFVPMQLAHAAGVESHLNAGNRFRNTKLPLCHLTGPAAVGLAHMRVGKRETQVRRRAGIGGRRIEHVRVLTLADCVVWGGIGTADSRRPAWLKHLVAGLGHRDGCAREHASGNGCRRQHIPAGEFTHGLPPFLCYGSLLLCGSLGKSLLYGSKSLTAPHTYILWSRVHSAGAPDDWPDREERGSLVNCSSSQTS